MTDKNGMDMARKLAVFRFSLIAPVIHGTYTEESASAYYRRVTENPILRPDGTEFLYKPKTLSSWTDKYRKKGLDGLTQKIRSDNGITRTLSNECLSEIYQIKEKFPKLNATQIRQRLLELRLITNNVSTRTVQRFIKNHNLKHGIPLMTTRDRKAFEEEFFGDLWMADTCYFPYISESGKNRRTYLVAILDDHSRLIVGAQLFYEDNAYNFQKVFKDAVATYGIPKKIYLDNNGVYRNNQLPFICAEIGTVLIHTPPYDGASKGKIERKFLSLKQQWIHGLDISTIHSLEEFNEKLNVQIRAHNIAKNTSIDERPLDRFLRTCDHITPPKSTEWLDLCFMNRTTRKVNNDATLRIDNIQFDAPIHFIGQNVQVRFLPDKLDEAYIYESETKYPLKLTDKVANSKAKRNNLPTIDYSWGDKENV